MLQLPGDTMTVSTMTVRTPPSANGGRPLHSILRNSILGSRKREEDDSIKDEEGSDGSQSSTKRRRVAFNLDDNTVVEIGQRGFNEVKKEVKAALEAHARGDNDGYNAIKRLFDDSRRNGDDVRRDKSDSSDDVDSGDLRTYVLALMSQAPLMGSSCNSLVRQILQCQWLGRSDAFVRAYVQFLAALASAHGSHLTAILGMLVDKFSQSRPSEWRAPRSITKTTAAGGEDGDGNVDVDAATARERLHTAVQYMIHMFPTATTIIRGLIVTKFPYAQVTGRVHKAYIENLLRLREYAVDIKGDIMDLIINQVVSIDVQMQLDLDDLDDETTARVLQSLQQTSEQKGAGISADDDYDSDDDDDSVATDEEDEDEEQMRVEEMKRNVQKMDMSLDILFELYTPHFADPDSDEAFSHYESLMAEFTNIILPTYKSRHTQFLVFHFGQLSPRLMDAFCGTCVNIAFESSRPMVLRQAAVAYLASFVARGVHVPGDIVRTVFDLLGYHMNDMRASFEPTCRGPDLRRYSTYYSLFQALIYMFCFRWRDLVTSAPESVDRDDPSSYLGHDLEWASGIRESLRQNIYSKLNPLKICSPSIVDEFARLAHHLRFLYVYPLLETNKRIRLSQFVSTSYAIGASLRDTGADSKGEEWHQLDPYFPFDPYQLPVSRRWVESDYLTWTEIPGLNKDGDDESSDDSGDDDGGDVAAEIDEGAASEDEDDD